MPDFLFEPIPFLSDLSISPPVSTTGTSSSSAEPLIPIQDPPTVSSYGQILRSSSIVGGASGVNYLVGMLRTKVVAVLLGPSGVGLVGLYVSITGMVATIAGLGIGTSGVREVALANGDTDPVRIAQTVTALRRLCWITGFLGWLLAAVFAQPLSLWIFQSPDYAWGIAILGVTILLGTITGGQTALIQGVRRVGDLARIQVISVLLNTLVAIAVYTWLREEGIVPVLIGTAIVQLLVSWHYARKIEISRVDQPLAETLVHAKRFVSLGAAFMVSGVMTAVVALLIRGYIVRNLGLDASGIYQAAWAISGMFAGFVLGAMGTDFYPRLTEAYRDHPLMNRLINEQTEIGILLALPGLLGTLAFAPWIMHVFYSAKFTVGAELLPWFVLGIFGQVISWPMGFSLAAKGASSWYIGVESIANCLRLGLTVTLISSFGLEGAAIAIPLLYFVHTFLLLLLCNHLTGFRWSSPALKLLSLSSLAILSGFAAQQWLTGVPAIALGVVLTAITGGFSLRGIASRLGRDHHLVQRVCRLPGVRSLCGV